MNWNTNFSFEICLQIMRFINFRYFYEKEYYWLSFIQEMKCGQYMNGRSSSQ